MLNAVQQLIVEERLVEEQVFDARVRLRHKINEVLGMEVPAPRDPDLPKRPQGSKPRPMVPSTPQEPAATSTRKRPRYSGNSPEWDFVYGDGRVPEPKRNDGPVPTDVMAVGDVSRDPTAPIAPYIPPTDPQGTENPFPMLNGPMG